MPFYSIDSITRNYSTEDTPCIKKAASMRNMIKAIIQEKDFLFFAKSITNTIKINDPKIDPTIQALIIIKHPY